MIGYVNSLTEGTILVGLESTRGRAYNLNQVVPGEIGSYEVSSLALITKQYLSARGAAGDICRFGITGYFDRLHYWSGAEKGDRKILDILLEYSDGTSASKEGIYIHDRSKLRPRGKENPFIEYLLSPNEWVWYKYQLVNPHPEKAVRYVIFKNTASDAAPRIGNVLHLRTRLRRS